MANEERNQEKNVKNYNYEWQTDEEIVANAHTKIVVSGKTYTFTVTVDATAPTLKLEGVENGGKMTGGVVLSEPSETAEIKVYRGEEEIEYKLGETISEEGEYRVTITDECGNSAVYTFTIEAGTNWTLIILLVVFGSLVAGGLVFFFIRRKKVADPDEA